ncbi:MAG: peptidoglycan DD-metalloendopeptidase family protein [Alphaproteobacteria bacterium]|jgi:murein DD-endopeptidase MepM/ murein hydrolase activator NlpD|nr:peptidoglycan DD-metalloendopeptidase family protein [Alphaproteobacteria bacterium]
MEKIKLILAGFYSLITLLFKGLSFVIYTLLVLFFKAIDVIATALAWLMQKTFTGLFNATVFVCSSLYYVVMLLCRFIVIVIHNSFIFIAGILKFIFHFVYHTLLFIFNFIKGFIYGIVPFTVSLPFRIIYIYFSLQEKFSSYWHALKKTWRNRRWSFFKRRHKYQYYLKTHVLNKIKVFNTVLVKFVRRGFNSTVSVIFKINLIFQKVIYNIYYAIKNAIFFVANLILMLYLLVKSLFLAIASVFSKNFWHKFFHEAYNLRIFSTYIVRVCYFEIRIFIKHSLIFIKKLLLFLWLDVLNFKKMGAYIRNNLLKSAAALILVSFLIYGFALLVFYPNQFDRLSKKHADSFAILNTPNLITEIVNSELFQPVLYYKDAIKVEGGSNLYAALIEKGIEEGNASTVVETLRKSYDLRKVNPNWIINTVVVSSTDNDTKKIQKLMLPIDNRFDLIIEADNGYNYTAYKQEKKLTRYILKRKTFVKDSIYASAVSSGISPNIAMEVFKVLSWDIDFQRDIRENNSLEVIFECIYNESNDLVTCDNLLYASIVGDRNTSFYKFNGEYYHDDGRSVVKTLVKTPINNARLSSTFGIRKHPVLGYTAAHKGIDFAAPTGTPIYAAGAGTVEMLYHSASYGNYIRIRHNPYLSSAYAHMNGFAKGIKVGDRVQQWQLIGYVGTTGISTGPHLHYEILVNGKQINPLTIKMPSNVKLSDDKLQDFMNYKTTFNNMAIRIPTRGKMVSPLGDVNFNGNFVEAK